MVRSTPKNILFLYAIKSMTSNTELINITHTHGHALSNTILEKIDTEYAFLQLNRRGETSGVILPEQCKE